MRAISLLRAGALALMAMTSVASFVGPAAAADQEQTAAAPAQSQDSNTGPYDGPAYDYANRQAW